MDGEIPLFLKPAAAYVRAALDTHYRQLDASALDARLFTLPLDDLDEVQLAALIALGRARELRLHRFKRTMGLARVQAVLGVLRGIGPSELLDIGSGRGAFLWPLVDAQPWLPITAIDTLPQRVAMIRQVAEGGIATLSAFQADATNLPFDDRSFDVVTMLEVLEHIPDTAAALGEVLRVARRFVIVSVPSRPDDNPEHIHLFRADQLSELLRQHGARNVNIEQVPGHVIAVARVGDG